FRSREVFRRYRKGSPAAAGRPSLGHDRSPQTCHRPKALPEALPAPPFPPASRATSVVSGRAARPSSLLSRSSVARRNANPVNRGRIERCAGSSFSCPKGPGRGPETGDQNGSILRQVRTAVNNQGTTVRETQVIVRNALDRSGLRGVLKMFERRFSLHCGTPIVGR